MDRTPNALLLALFKLPDPPDCRLVDTGVGAGIEDQGEGAAARGAVGERSSSGRRGSEEATACLVNPRLDTIPVETGEGGGVGHGHKRLFLGDEAVGEGPSSGRRGSEEEAAASLARVNPRLDTIPVGRGEGGGVGRGHKRLLLGDEARCRRVYPRVDAIPVGRGEGGAAGSALEGDEAAIRPGIKRDVHLNSSWIGKDKGALGAAQEQPIALMGIAMTASSINCASDRCRCSSHAEKPTCSVATPNNSSVSFSGRNSLWTAALVVADLAGATAHGSARMLVYDPSYEILLCDGKVLSKPWKEIWETIPLVLHDKNLVRCFPVQHELRDLTEVISSILENHPGSARYFRLDSSKWTGGARQLSKWLRRLSDKEISEIIIMNQTYESLLKFPLEDIECSSLKGLRLGFFALPDLDLYCFDYGNLDTLELIGCTFDTHRLYHVVKDCQKLAYLGIGLSIRDVKLHSKSLQHLQIWRCKMRSFTVELCPSLQRVVIGARPKEECVSFTIRGTPCLQEFEYMFLPVNKTEDPTWLNTLKKVSLGIQFDNSAQRKLLCDYLKHVSTLQKLTLWRMDDVGLSEELDVAVDDTLLSLSNDMAFSRMLMELEIRDFRGGGAELAVARDVLKCAVSLRKLWVYICPHASSEKVKRAYKELRSMERVSANCSFVNLKPSS